MDAKQFNEAMRQLSEPVTNLEPPYWEAWRRELWQLGQSNDPANFMHWPCVYYTMLVRHWTAAVEFEYRYLMQDARRWSPVIVMSTVGDDYYGDTIFSQNLIHQAYHLKLWEDTTGQRIDALKSITEFGGGYGAMALVCHRLGFTGQYKIHDLPEFCFLQKWFLSQCGVTGVVHPSKFTKQQPDLLVAMYSLSETPMEVRDKFLSLCSPASYLFLYSGQWEAWDNVAYFGTLAKMMVSRNWREMELKHLPDLKNYYLIGW